MTMPDWSTPGPTECPATYRGYLARVPPGHVLDTLARQITETSSLLAPLDAAAAEFRYAPDKWSVKEVIGHLCDVERVFAYRALRFARNDAIPLPGFEQDDYVVAGGFGARSLTSLVAELEAVRHSTVALFGGLDGPAVARRGTASGGEFTVRVVAYIIAGHELHHRAILQERYLHAETM